VINGNEPQTSQSVFERFVSDGTVGVNALDGQGERGQWACPRGTAMKRYVTLSMGDRVVCRVGENSLKRITMNLPQKNPNVGHTRRSGGTDEGGF